MILRVPKPFRCLDRSSERIAMYFSQGHYFLSSNLSVFNILHIATLEAGWRAQHGMGFQGSNPDLPCFYRS